MNTILLFSTPETYITGAASKPEVITPLGTLLFHSHIGDFQSDASEPTVVAQLQNGELIFSWQTRAFDLELLLCNPETSLARTDADDCWAGIWRLAAKADTPPVLLACSWTADATWTEGGPNTEQYLVAWIWDKGDTSISIGTEDDDGLLRRVRTGGLPQRWKSYFELPHWQQRYGYDYDRNGIPVRLPAMLKGEQCEIKFIIAWSTVAGYLNERNVLEMPTAAVLASCHCV